MLGLPLNSIGQNRYHIDETFTKDGKFRENSVVYSLKDSTKINGILDSDDRIKFEIEFKNMAKSWRTDGSKKCFVNYENGEMHGKRKCWHDNGFLWIDGFYTKKKMTE